VDATPRLFVYGKSLISTLSSISKAGYAQHRNFPWREGFELRAAKQT